jgi:hypothetical protein
MRPQRMPKPLDTTPLQGQMKPEDETDADPVEPD